MLQKQSLNCREVDIRLLDEISYKALKKTSFPPFTAIPELLKGPPVDFPPLPVKKPSPLVEVLDKRIIS